MSTDRDVTRIVRSWLDEGTNVLPDRVLDAVLDQLPATPQRRATWLARRFAPMNNTFRAAAVAAVILLAILVTINLLPGLGVGGPKATATPEPTATAVPTATAAPSSGVAGACDLITAAEAGQALHLSAAVRNEQTPDGRYCSYLEGGAGAEFMIFSYAKNDVSTFEAWKTNTGIQPVSGLGDDALWDPNQHSLIILKGTAIVAITVDTDPSLEAAKAVGAIMAGRM